jgi:uncharacterized protein (DUF2252 family)
LALAPADLALHPYLTVRRSAEHVANVAPDTSFERIARATVDVRAAQGRSARLVVPRKEHARWQAAPSRPDPLSLLRLQDATRVPELVPIRYGRMVSSPLAFFRGAAIVMAEDLASTATSGIATQLCGDAHLSNFGVYGSPERTLLFDVNDFDETLPGPWEWDVKRLATSFVVAGRANGSSDDACREAAIAAAGSYRSHMAGYASMRDLDVWYSHVTAENVIELASDPRAKKALRAGVAKTQRRDNLQALSKLTTTVDGRPRILHDPPLLVRVDAEDLVHSVDVTLHAYVRTLQDDRRHLLDRYRLADVAHKVVGVGSVGTRCFIALLLGRDDDDPLFLQIKEASASVLERHLPKSRYRNHAQRVVAGQRLMQASSDIFLGWIRGEDGRDYYWRQLRDMKASVDVGSLTPAAMSFYATICGWALARAHARSGDRIAIAAYLGNGGRFDRAVASFAMAYADQNERDHGALVAAIEQGTIEADPGV